MECIQCPAWNFALFPTLWVVRVPVNQVVWNFAHLIYDMAGWGKVERVRSTEYRDFVQSLGTHIHVYLVVCIVHVESTQVQTIVQLIGSNPSRY